jgi:two-component system cell cycle sensor histidine kinase/response regulator CckA
MKKTSARVIRITSAFAILLSMVVATAAPLGYFVIAYENEAAVLKTEVLAEATDASQLISANPDYWRFEQHRLEEFLSERPFGEHNEIRRIVDVNHNVIAVSADAIDPPLMTRAHELYDSGAVVARMEVSRSLRPVIIRTLVLLVLGLVLGTGMFVVLRVFPLNALSRALQSIQESEGKFSAIASTAADAIVVMDSKGIITYWNPAATRIFGYTVEETLGRGLHNVIAPVRYREAFAKGFEKFRQSGQGPAVGNTLEFIAVRKDGTEFPIEVSTSTIPLDGEWHAVGIVRDISERKKTEQELIKLEKLESLGVLAGGLAHDFNNLLTIILGNISLSLVDMKLTDQNFKRLTDVEKAVLRAQDLTRQLLTFAKGGAPVKQTASIREIIEDSCRFSLSGSNVQCLFSFAEDLKAVEVDAGQIGQVVSNLVINAVQAMPEGGTIRVKAENVAAGLPGEFPLVPRDFIRISVEDEGTGIPQENLGKIFDPYFTTKQKGSGLGLATGFSIIKRHGGYIAVESVVGKGSAFHIYLPATVREPLREKMPEKKLVAGMGKILVMDDEESVRDVVGEMLKAAGYEYELAKNGSEAIELYKRALEGGRPFDAAIMDLTIPGGLGGKEAVKKLIEIDPKVKAIVASGYFSDPVMADFKAHGFIGVITKPYDLQTLSRTLRTVLT